MSLSDVELIIMIGSEVADGFVVLEKDYSEIERELKQTMNRIRRLRGKRVVLAGDCLITAFHANQREGKRLRREARGLGLEAA
jgi:hypothetical protein